MQPGSGAAAIPLLGALALKHNVFCLLCSDYSWASLKSYNAAIQAVLEMLKQPLPPGVTVSESFSLRESIRLEECTFTTPLKYQCSSWIESRNSSRRAYWSYQRYRQWKFSVDLLMGLLPSSGKLLVDGLDCMIPKIQRSSRLAGGDTHVPQSIYLADSSIANIAFGVPRHLISLPKVKQAAEQAQIASFIESAPESYESFVGERGIRLSGGQRQGQALLSSL